MTLEPDFAVSRPRVALEGPLVNVAGWSYDISADGKRFLVLENEELGVAATRLAVITNFFENLRRLDPGP